MSPKCLVRQSGRRLALREPLLVPVDPLGHRPYAAKALDRHGTAFDAGKTFGEGNLLGRRATVYSGGVGQSGLRFDPGAQAAPILLNLPGQEGLVGALLLE